MAVSAAPRDRYYDQMGNKYWCNSDSYGCWVTSENGEHEYIMFWSESARDTIMGPDSKAPLGTNPGTSELGLLPPKSAKSTSGGGTACTKDKNYCETVEAPSWTSCPTGQSWDCIVDDADTPNCHCDCVCK